MRAAPPTIRNPFERVISTQGELVALLGLEESAFKSLVEVAPSSYSVFQQPKKSGGYREIRPPRKPLRVVQRRIYRLLERRIHYPRWMMGGVPGRSIIKHAEPHVGRWMVATLDVKSFFPSVRATQVRAVLERFAIKESALDALVRLTTLDDQLPQGSPASCFLANLVFDSVDRRIDALCRKHGFFFTRYVDDLAISGDRDLHSFRGAFITPIEEYGFHVSTQKIHFMDRSVAQVVTNLCVNDKMRPTKAFINEVSEDIWSCLKGGGPHLLAHLNSQTHSE
jgi:RNA-directed DNA polymerase